MSSSGNKVVVNLTENAPVSSSGTSYQGVFQCVVTDTVYNSTQTIQITVTFNFNNNN